MADDHRYDHAWLDDDAVERLLRGAPLDAGAPADARATAERLDAAFRTLTGTDNRGSGTDRGIGRDTPTVGVPAACLLYT